MIDTSIPKAPLPKLGESIESMIMRDLVRAIELAQEEELMEAYEWHKRRLAFYGLKTDEIIRGVKA